MIDLRDDAVVYVDYEEHRLVTNVLQDNDRSRRRRIISFGKRKPCKTRCSPRELQKLRSGYDRPRRWRHTPREVQITSFGHERLRRWRRKPHGLRNKSSGLVSPRRQWLTPRGLRKIPFGNKHENVGEHAAVHVDDENHRLVMIDLRENDVVHPDYE